MENVAYIALSRQMTLRRELDIVASNVANADTVGFKVEQLLVGTEAGRGARNDPIKAPANFVLDNGVGRDFGQGEMRVTGNTFDVAIEGEDAFFQIGAENGERYTRDGRFTTDPQGRLVTQQGFPVLGEGGGEILLDPQRSAPSISADGVITQDGERVGKIGVVRFPALSALSKEGDNLYVNASNQQPEAAPDARIRQGVLEGSNVKPVVEITSLIEITRAYEKISKMIEQSTELSRRSVERLGRVS